MNTPIHQQLRNLRTTQQLLQRDAAHHLGVHLSSITAWDSGRKTPFIHHAHAYANLLHHRLVATIDGAPIDDLINLLPELPDMRRRHGITQKQLGHAMHTTAAAVNSVEGRIHAGDRLVLATADWYLAGHGYGIALIPALPLERAA